MTGVCPECDAELPSDATYCSACGHSVNADAPTGDGTTLATITHVLGLLTWVIGPLIVLVITEDAFVRENAKAAIMWQLMLAIYAIISVILIIFVIGILLLIVLAFLDLVFCIIAAIKASEGEAWKYPLTPAI